jgi:murein DD-endopeptidase MepM/ murein hydrolase activator NlpD
MKVLFAFLLASLPVLANGTPLPPTEPVPGGVAVIELPLWDEVAPKVEMDGRHIMVLPEAGRWYAVVGIPLDATVGEKTLEIGGDTDLPFSIRFSVGPKNYPQQLLTIQNPEMVNPTAAQEVRIEREQLHLDKVMKRWRQTANPGIEFIWPAAGPETSPFGVRRVLNGEPRSPHSGIDIGGETGTPLHAPADAVVADKGNYYFCGRTLTLDMGQGLFSVFCHMSKISVKRGQRVKQGQLVGLMGATGRTTGPNLHWTVRLNGAAVDPHVFLGARAPAPKPATRAAPAAAGSH